MIGTTLYTVDSKGKTRWWKMEQDGPRFRTISGLLDGKAIETAWTECFPKNVGRANATTAEEQCSAEILSIYKKKLDRKYYTADDFNTADSGSRGYKFDGPMLATKYDKFPTVGTVYAQPKLDGYRSTAAETAGLLSRQGKPWRHEHIMEALQDVFKRYPGIVLDGELYNHDLKDDFNSLGSLIKKDKRTAEQDAQTREVVQYHIYDILSHEGTFTERYNLLGEIFALIGPDSPIKLVTATIVKSAEELDALYVEYLEAGYEGQMVRIGESYYEGNGKRSTGLQKRKEFEDAEFKIKSVHEGKGNWSGYAKSLFFLMPDGRKTEMGEDPKAGIKGTKAFTKELLENWQKYEGVTIRYFTATPAGIPRFGVAVAWHESLEFRG